MTNLGIELKQNKNKLEVTYEWIDKQEYICGKYLQQK